MTSRPLLSVVICTFERPDGAADALRSVTEVLPADCGEVIIVDDGSSASAAAALDELAAPTIRVVHQENSGLTAARIRGAAESRGRWIAFLDDDDRWLGGWASLVAMLDDDTIGIVSGAAVLERPDGRIISTDRPEPLGPMFEDLSIQYLAGCFAVRRDVYLEAGGFLPGLSSSHQTELMLRCAAVCVERKLGAQHTDEAVARIERRAEPDRSQFDPRLLYDGTRWNLCRHDQRFSRSRKDRANWEAVAATNAARLGDPRAMHHAWRSVRAQPTSPVRWARLVLLTPLISRLRWRRWTGPREPTSAHSAPLRHAVSLRGSPAAALCSDSDLLFLPWRYRENPPASADAAGTPFWDPAGPSNDVRYQDPVYRWAARLVADRTTRVVDIGCGSGDKLVARLAPLTDRWVGVDQPSAIELARRLAPDGTWIAADLEDSDRWGVVASGTADLVICADVIEHVRDPLELLQRLSELVSPTGRILVSTPDRARLEDRDPLGPPLNPRHIREWTDAEFRLLLESAGLRVESARHLLPRSYSPTATELRRAVHRLLHGRALPDRRSCMAFLLVPAADPPIGT